MVTGRGSVDRTKLSSIRRPLRCWLGLHRWRLYSLADLVWPEKTRCIRQVCSRCKKRRVLHSEI